MPLEFSDTVQPGVYAVVPPDNRGAADGPPRQMFVANLEGYESDLTYLDDVLASRSRAGKLLSRQAAIESGLKELLPGRPLVAYVGDPARVSEASMTARRGFKLWDLVLWIVLLIALFEPWLANRISLRHYAGPGTKLETRSSKQVQMPQRQMANR